ncbi:MAG: hypothetical protein MJE12_00990 [Alphaproteobacteria bacterium]|nr:hypothetical protein [Alphaproteobacteria bacterium]
MQALKGLVFGMAALIVVGVGLLIYGISQNVGPAMGEGEGPAPFGTIRASLPAGATVQDVHLDGDSLVVRLTLAGGGATLLVFRLSDGRQIGTIELQPGQ